MRAFAIMAVCIGATFGISSIDAVSDAAAPFNRVVVHASVDRTHKGDRRPLPPQHTLGAQIDFALPEGCDGLVSPLASKQLARAAAHCES